MKSMNITITGPRSVGKSTISKLLAKRLKYRYVESDALMHKEMQDCGGLDKTIKAGKTELIMIRGQKVIDDALDGDKIVFDLPSGAIASIKGTSMGTCKHAIDTISRESLVVGLLPFKEDAASMKLLLQRERKRPHFADMDPKELDQKVKKDYLKLKPVLTKVAKIIVYVGDKTPEAIVDEISAKNPF